MVKKQTAFLPFEEIHPKRASIPDGKVGPSRVRSVLFQAHVLEQNGIEIYSAAFGRRNSLREGL